MMPHETSLISTLAVGLGLAFVLGYIALWLRLSPLVGYLLAGTMVGPFTPGFVPDTELAPQLAEIGVILLMFGVGMHFSIGDLLAVRNIALPGAITQIVAATALGAGLAFLWGWSLGAGLVFGLALSVVSTVVLLRASKHKIICIRRTDELRSVGSSSKTLRWFLLLYCSRHWQECLAKIRTGVTPRMGS